MRTSVSLYHRHPFPAEIISHCVWLYFRFALSFRDVEEMLAMRGVALTYETVREWCLKFGQTYANGLRRRSPRPGDRWHLDELFLKINGRAFITSGMHQGILKMKSHFVLRSPYRNPVLLVLLLFAIPASASAQTPPANAPAQQRPSLRVTNSKEELVVETLDAGNNNAALPILKTLADYVAAEHLIIHPLLKYGRELRAFSAQQPIKTAEQPKAISTRFADVTSALGLNFQHIASHTSRKYLIETMGSGVALFDYDNDGRLDIFAVNGAPLSDPTPRGTIPQKTDPKYWNRLYHQKQDGAFEDMTERAGLQGVGYGMGVAVGDYDNDGYEDLYVTAYGGNKLYRNNGDGKFTDVTEKAGVGGSGWSTSAAWVDLDGDGLLDLVVLRYVQWDFDDIWCGERKQGYRAYCTPDAFHPTTPFVYHNDGKGHFTDVSRKIGLAEPGKGLGIALADFDRDGRIDIFVANDSMVEFLYHNKSDRTFEEVGLMSGVAVDGEGHTYAGMGVDFADYNNDGLPDLVITDLANQMYALYRNNGDGTFTYDTYLSGIGRMTMMHSGWGVRFLDYDNDGWKDLLIAQGHDLDTIELTFPNLRYREPMLLARNTGQGFVDVSADAGSVFREAWVGRGMAIGDIDNDGRLDAVVTTNDGALYVLRNATLTQNHWLTLRLVGHKSNRDAIGAEVKVVTAKGSQSAIVTTTSSYLSSSDKRVHFGLGAETFAAMIEIRWPSGIRQTLKNVRAEQILQVDEPPAGIAGEGPRK